MAPEAMVAARAEPDGERAEVGMLAGAGRESVEPAPPRQEKEDGA